MSTPFSPSTSLLPSVAVVPLIIAASGIALVLILGLAYRCLRARRAHKSSMASSVDGEVDPDGGQDGQPRLSGAAPGASFSYEPPSSPYAGSGGLSDGERSIASPVSSPRMPPPAHRRAREHVVV